MDSIEENSKEFLSSKYSKTQTSKSQSQIQEEIEKRIGRAEYELTFADKFDTIIINDDLNKAKEETYEKVFGFTHMA